MPVVTVNTIESLYRCRVNLPRTISAVHPRRSNLSVEGTVQLRPQHSRDHVYSVHTRPQRRLPYATDLPGLLAGRCLVLSTRCIHNSRQPSQERALCALIRIAPKSWRRCHGLPDVPGFCSHRRVEAVAHGI
ncbi:hypothetical protein BD413DRAFT_259706 [Trametes elegans]|nr:hypothetical protein BD413DRAFT_259706 [Trametes elegans]